VSYLKYYSLKYHRFCVGYQTRYFDPNNSKQIILVKIPHLNTHPNESLDFVIGTETGRNNGLFKSITNLTGGWLKLVQSSGLSGWFKSMEGSYILGQLPNRYRCSHWFWSVRLIWFNFDNHEKLKKIKNWNQLIKIKSWLRMYKW